MKPTSSFSFVFLTFLFFSSATAFNITKMLNQNSDFSNFNDLLSQSGVASQINSRETITVLALDNGAASGISSKSKDEIKNILSLHVVLDYYDPQKLNKLSKKTAILTTLFQTSGEANKQMGFVNVTVTSNGVAFGSAVKGSQIDSMLVKSVTAQPYNISVLQISAPIIPEGIDGVKSNSNSTSPSASPAGAPKKAPSPKSHKSGKAPAPSDDSAETPSDAPEASSPPEPVEADAPSGDTADAPGPSAKKSSGARVSVGMFVSVVTLGVASWFAF